INYDLILNDSAEPKYEKGFTYPVIAAEAQILSRDMISHMYNQRILAKLGFNPKTTTSDAYKDPRIGTIQMFESREEKIPIYLDIRGHSRRTQQAAKRELGQAPLCQRARPDPPRGCRLQGRPRGDRLQTYRRGICQTARRVGTNGHRRVQDLRPKRSLRMGYQP